jgi:thiopeptide-type bacteriocin biosynthesis protein
VAPSIVRSFPPGSEWLYAKLYTGMAAADQALREVVAPVVRAAERSGAIDRWFFIRYTDPGHHVRVRFHGAPERLYGEVLPALHQAAQPLLADGRVWRVQLDTYEREVERYGGAAGIELAEQLFHADSAAALAIVERGAGDGAVMRRWRLALRGIDMLLENLGFDPEARHALIRQARDGYAQEFRADARLSRQLGDAYRRERKNLESLLDPALDEQSLRPGLAALRARSDRLAPIGAELRARERDGLLAVERLALSFTHMHANRLLRSAQRHQELVLYEFLDRLYEARAARSRTAA